MNNAELNKIQEKVKLKIAISNFEKEDKGMSKQKILKMAAMFVITIGIIAGTTYAGSIVYEKIFKEPEKIENYIEELKINEEDLGKIISEEEAKNRAKEELEKYQITLNDNEIEKIEIQKSPNYDTITYVISTNKKDQFFIDAITGSLTSFQIDDGLSLEEIEKCTSNKEEIIKQAQNKMKEYGYSDEYKISYVNCNIADNEEQAYMWYIWFSKEYNGVFNEYQSISMTIIPKINKVIALSIQNEPFENNPIEISKEEAIEIAKEKDKIINTENYMVKNVNAEIGIKRINPEVYLKENELENEIKTITLEDGSKFSYNTYKMNGAVRNMYIVEIIYENRPILSSRKYFVDVTTGEVVGGAGIFDVEIDEGSQHEC